MNFPTGPEITTYTCSECNATVSAAASKCPSCGISFDYTENPDGTRTHHSSSWRFSGRGVAGLIKLGIFVVAGIAGLVGAAMKKFSGGE